MEKIFIFLQKVCDSEAQIADLKNGAKLFPFYDYCNPRDNGS